MYAHPRVLHVVNDIEHLIKLPAGSGDRCWLVAAVSSRALAAAVEVEGRGFEMRVLAGGAMQCSHLVMEEG